MRKREKREKREKKVELNGIITKKEEEMNWFRIWQHLT